MTRMIIMVLKLFYKGHIVVYVAIVSHNLNDDKCVNNNQVKLKRNYQIYMTRFAIFSSSGTLSAIAYPKHMAKFQRTKYL